MARPRAGEIIKPFQLVVAVWDFEHDRAAERGAAPNACANFDGIVLDSLPAAATVTALSPPELDIDRLGIDRYAGRKAVDQRDERLAV